MNTISTIEADAGRDYLRIAEAIAYLVENRLEQPELEDVARHVGLSPYHFQRLFTRWAGVGPKKFLQYLTLGHAKQRLRASESLLDAAFDVGLSGPSRLHDLFVSLEAVSPGEFKSRGEGLDFRYGFHDSPFGECLIVASPRGVTGLSFVDGGDRDRLVAEQRRGWENACWAEDGGATESAARAIFERQGGEPLTVLARGTAFQVKVWEALLRVPEGAVASYGRLAEEVCTRDAARAVGAACGANLVGYLIPCHRVIRDTGAITGYRWGEVRKRAMIALEAARADAGDGIAA